MDSGAIIYNDHPRKVLEEIPVEDSLIPVPKLIQLVRMIKQEFGFLNFFPLTVEEFIQLLVGE